MYHDVVARTNTLVPSCQGDPERPFEVLHGWILSRGVSNDAGGIVLMDVYHRAPSSQGTPNRIFSRERRIPTNVLLCRLRVVMIVDTTLWVEQTFALRGWRPPAILVPYRMVLTKEKRENLESWLGTSLHSGIAGTNFSACTAVCHASLRVGTSTDRKPGVRSLYIEVDLHT